MLFCPDCRHQLARTWAGDVCGLCGKSYKNGAVLSVIELAGFRAAGLAYAAALQSLTESPDPEADEAAVIVDPSGLLKVDSHFPRVVWNTRFTVRSKYLASVTAPPVGDHSDVVEENEYPLSRFSEQSSVDLRLLFYGRAKRSGVFDPTEHGELRKWFIDSHARVEALAKRWASASKGPLGYCDRCGLLSQLSPAGPMRRQIESGCVDCRGTARPYLVSLEEAGLIRRVRVGR